MPNPPNSPGDRGDQELSPAGNPIYRHKERTIPFDLAAGDPDRIQRVSEHIERHLGEIDGVYHEIVSDLVHIDVHIVNPTPERNCYTLVTSGMSEAPMNVPEGAEELRFAELLIQLPPEWPLDRLQAIAGKSGGSAENRPQVERFYWPIRWLKSLARMPHEYDTWLGTGHTVPTGDPPEPYADDTRLCCMLLLPAMNVPEEFGTLELGPDKSVHFYSLVPIYPEEMELKLNEGAEALLELFDKNDVSVVVNPRRPSVCPPKRKKWFGLF